MIHRLWYFSRPSWPSNVCSAAQASYQRSSAESSADTLCTGRLLHSCLPSLISTSTVGQSNHSRSERPLETQMHQHGQNYALTSILHQSRHGPGSHTACEAGPGRGRTLRRRACLAFAQTAIWKAPAAMNRNAVSVRVANANASQPQISNV